MHAVRHKHRYRLEMRLCCIVVALYKGHLAEQTYREHNSYSCGISLGYTMLSDA